MSKNNSKFKYPEIKFLLLYLMFIPFTPINAGGVELPPLLIQEIQQ